MILKRIFIFFSIGIGTAVVSSSAQKSEKNENKGNPTLNDLLDSEALDPKIRKIDFSLLYPTLANYEPVLLPNQLAARDEKLKSETAGPQSVFLKPPPQVTISHVYELHVVSDCVGGQCSYGSLNVYLQKTNWFVNPEEALLSSLSSALKNYALKLASKKHTSSTFHKNVLIRSPRIWFSNARTRLKAEIGSVCFMQPTTRQGRKNTWKMRWQRAHKQAKIKSLLDISKNDSILVEEKHDNYHEIQDFVPFNAIFITKEDRIKGRQLWPQNLFTLCRMPRSNIFRRLAEKKFVLCTVVLRDEKHVVDACKDLPVHDIHTMQAVYEVHRRLSKYGPLPMLGYVPTTLPPDSKEVVDAFVKNLQPTPLESSDAAIADECIDHISHELEEIETMHISELWHAAETSKPIRPSLLMRSLIKFSHFHKRELAPENTIERRPSLLKLVNKWSRTNELIRRFNAAVVSCPNPTIRPIYFPQFQSKILITPEEHIHDLLAQLQRILNINVPTVHRLLLGGSYLFSWILNPRNISGNSGRNELAELVERTRELLISFAKRHLTEQKAIETVSKYATEIIGKAKLVLESALPLELQLSLIRSLLPVPFFLFAVGSHCGPAEKHDALDLGYGLCPYHFLSFFVKEATTAAEKHPELEDWAKRLISKWVKTLHVKNLPARARADADVFLEQHAKELPIKKPDLFLTRKGKTYKAFPAPISSV